MKKLLFFTILLSHACTGFYFVDNKTKDGSLDPNFINQIVQTFNRSILIETGTYNGVTAINASPFFEKIHSIELDQKLYKSCLERTAVKNNITLYNGDSGILLPQIIGKYKDAPIVFWLDAHYCGESTARTNNNDHDPESFTAIRSELKAIASADCTDCVILIDDMRGFGSKINDTEFLGCWAYPCIQEVCALCLDINPNFAFALLGDTLMAYDQKKYNPPLSIGVKALTASRLYNGQNLSDYDLIEIEQMITNQTTNEEKLFVTELYKRMTSWKDPLFHHDLWYGLVAMGTNKWNEAQEALTKVLERTEYLNTSAEKVCITRSYKPQRIQNYLDQISAINQKPSA